VERRTQNLIFVFGDMFAGERSVNPRSGTEKICAGFRHPMYKLASKIMVCEYGAVEKQPVPGFRA
jgi:hypothetical protein